MNGPQHYQEAERLLRDIAPSREITARAQVHATLALTAATAEYITREGATYDWVQVLGDD